MVESQACHHRLAGAVHGEWQECIDYVFAVYMAASVVIPKSMNNNDEVSKCMNNQWPFVWGHLGNKQKCTYIN